jgi:aryl-alcohol dehydrogenase-like predicted oxidoreductase
MEKIRLGRTNLMVSRSSFGALPIQRVGFDDAKKLLLMAFENGINFFDTARSYSDSEEKLANALGPVRKNIIIATKTLAKDVSTLNEQLATSLKTLKTDYIDIYQLHNPPKLPDPNDADGLYQTLVKARQKGMVRFIGISSHRQDVARGTVESGLYDTLQYPLNSLSDDEELKIVRTCREHDVGFIGMKAMSGGLLSSCRSTFAFIRQFDHAVPVWGVQRESELREILELEKNPPVLDDQIRAEIKKDRQELGGNFCRACGYCLPCPALIPIPMAARMGLLLRRMPWRQFMSEEWRQNMDRIEDCDECGNCRDHCPYGLDTPNLLRKMLDDYRRFRKGKNM